MQYAIHDLLWNIQTLNLVDLDIEHLEQLERLTMTAKPINAMSALRYK